MGVRRRSSSSRQKDLCARGSPFTKICIPHHTLAPKRVQSPMNLPPDYPELRDLLLPLLGWNTYP